MSLNHGGFGSLPVAGFVRREGRSRQSSDFPRTFMAGLASTGSSRPANARPDAALVSPNRPQPRAFYLTPEEPHPRKAAVSARQARPPQCLKRPRRICSAFADPARHERRRRRARQRTPGIAQSRASAPLRRRDRFRRRGTIPSGGSAMPRQHVSDRAGGSDSTDRRREESRDAGAALVICEDGTGR
jgi:hypothetical protein